MIKKYFFNSAVFLSLSLSVSCVNFESKNTTEEEPSKREYSIQSVLWQQHSAEHRALFYQAYNIALDRLKLIEKENESEKPLAIISDLDETVIDNSYYNAKLIEEDAEYSQDSWKEWVLLENATALPGAISFFNTVQNMGIEVFYISNRADSEKTATINNLKKLGLPNADSLHILLKTNSSGKQNRRDLILKDYEVVLYLGDNMSDFSDLYDNKGTNQRNDNTDSLQMKFGREFIVFPNIIYGDWESKGIYESNFKLSREEKDSIRRSKLISY